MNVSRIITLSEVGKIERQMPHDSIYLWNLKINQRKTGSYGYKKLMSCCKKEEGVGKVDTGDIEVQTPVGNEEARGM